jgi:hypothetical protein
MSKSIVAFVPPALGLYRYLGKDVCVLESTSTACSGGCTLRGFHLYGLSFDRSVESMNCFSFN